MTFLGQIRRPMGSNRNPLHLIEHDLVASAVVKLGGARAVVRRHGLGVFERAARLEGRAGPVTGSAAALV